MKLKDVENGKYYKALRIFGNAIYIKVKDGLIYNRFPSEDKWTYYGEVIKVNPLDNITDLEMVEVPESEVFLEFL